MSKIVRWFLQELRRIRSTDRLAATLGATFGGGR
jgi:hypothetical protein